MGYTPFFLNYGRHLVTPLTWYLPTMAQQVPSHRDAVAALRAENTLPQIVQFIARLETALQRARLCLAAVRDRTHIWADAHRFVLTFAQGDLVLLSTKNLRLKTVGSRKLLPKWIGPFPMTGTGSPVAYRLQLPSSLRAIHPVFQASPLRPYCQ